MLNTPVIDGGRAEGDGHHNEGDRINSTRKKNSESFVTSSSCSSSSFFALFVVVLLFYLGYFDCCYWEHGSSGSPCDFRCGNVIFFSFFYNLSSHLSVDYRIWGKIQF